MKPRFFAALLAVMMIFPLAGCEKSLLDKDDPVTLTFWHVYGEQSGSPMDELVDEFNRTVGAEKGVQVTVTGTSSASQIGSFLLRAQAGAPEVPEMPDVFTCHIGDALALGAENLLDWNDLFTAQERAEFVPGFLADGTTDGKLAVFPMSKSTHVLMLNGSAFDRFSAATGAQYSDLATWEGFYQTAGAFYDYSGGRTFCALDYPIRAVELRAMERGAADFYTEDGWYDTDNAIFKESWLEFARALVQGHVQMSDRYSNTQVMTGETISGIGSSAAILYYNDKVSYLDGTVEPMNLQVLPLPKTDGADALMTQAGVGLCAYQTDEQRAEAASLFVHWLTEPERNLDFVAETGYMPVRSGAFDAIEDYADFPEPQQAYQNLYAALNTMRQEYTPLSEPGFPGYYGKVNALYETLREAQRDYPARLAAGESVGELANETWAQLCSMG